MNPSVPSMIYPFLMIFPFLMIYSAFADLFTMIIPNKISLVLVLIFPALAYAVGVPLETIGWHLTCGAGMLVLTFSMFAMGWIGGGDAKLAAATAIWVGWEHMLDYGFIASLIGGALTMAFLFLRRTQLPKLLMSQVWIERLHNNANGVPYGIALAAAGLIVYPETQVWLGAFIR